MNFKILAFAAVCQGAVIKHKLDKGNNASHEEPNGGLA